jgi:nicotinate-nucleotide pyrophosphorylase (carboxylating)
MKLDQNTRDALALSLKEDLGSGDITSLLLPENLAVTASLISREPMLMCGQAWFTAVMHLVDKNIDINWHIPEGKYQKTPETLCTITGLARSILTAERTAMNWLQTLAGTATQTYHFTQILKPYKTKLLDTRKTIPCLRFAQKYAVKCAGGNNQRMGLYDAFLIKENHIAACGSITAAIAAARKMHKHVMLEVEVSCVAEFCEAHKARPDRIMLDNFNEDMIREVVKINRPQYIPLEVSGGINLENICRIAELGVDFISVGCLTKSLTAIDLSLLL